jgi:glycosyltransferase involved in cell wall biosynthesis
MPPPVTGMTLLTERIIKRLQEAGPVTFLNWSPSAPGNKFRSRVERALRTIGCVCRLLMHGPVHDARLYLVASSRAGLLMTAILASVGRMLGYRLYLHHHTYYYIDRYDWRVAWINRTMGPQGTHIVHTAEMAEDFRVQYPSQSRFKYVLPSVFALPLGRPRDIVAAPFRLGHMGNLMMEKGLDLVIESFRNLRKQGRDVRLVLGGPFQTAEAERLVRRTIQEHPQDVEYQGPVYGEAKGRYFQAIDCFLFPSRSESWGIVLNEAMAAGVPGIAFARGCTATLVGNAGAGLIVENGADFVGEACRQITTWIDSAEEYRKASCAAIQRADELNRRGKTELDRFAEIMFAPLPSSG